MTSELFNKSARVECILTNSEYGYKETMLLTADQIRLIKYLIDNDVLDHSIFTFIILDNEDFKEI